MPQYRITLNFTFGRSQEDEYEGYNESYSDSDSEQPEKPMSKMQEAFFRTDKYYETHSLEDHVKSNDAKDFVETLLLLEDTTDLVSAEWDPNDFALHMVVKSDQTAEELKEELEDNSLEDGEYEACGETGWILMTRGPNGEVFSEPWDSTDTWEYGLTDYRQNPIIITQIS